MDTLYAAQNWSLIGEEREERILSRQLIVSASEVWSAVDHEGGTPNLDWGCERELRERSLQMTLELDLKR